MRMSIVTTMILAIIAFIACDKSNPLLKVNHSYFETIEHAAIHIQDGTGLVRIADSVMPGPHLDHDSIDHRRLDIALPAMDAGFGGYIHFGPDITGDIIVCIDVETPVAVTNRTGTGDSPIEIERIFTAQEIADSAKTNLIRTAVLFEAKTGGNILKIGPATQPNVKVVIEEAEHEHEQE